MTGFTTLPAFSRVVLLGAISVCWSSLATADVTVCISGGVGSTKLRVTVPAERRQQFIEFLQSPKENIALGAYYVGGAEGSDRLSISFYEPIDLKREAGIVIWADNKKPTAVFDFYFQTCNTKRSLKAYVDGARRRIIRFGEVTITELPSN